MGDFLQAVHIAVDKFREFGFSDEDFGGPIRLVQRKPGEKANGRYIPKGDDVQVFNPPVRGAPDFLWTVVHEVLHRIWVKHVDDQSQEFWAALCEASGKTLNQSAVDALVRVAQSKPDKSSLWFYFRKHFGDDLGLFRMWLKTRKVSDSFPSQYASSDPSEAFAEVGANIILGRGHAGREMRRSGSMVRKVFLCMVSPLRNKSYMGRVFEDLLSEDVMPRKDENFLQTQVDFGYLRVVLPKWVDQNIPADAILKVENRPHATVYYGADKRDLDKIQEVVQSYGRPIRVSLGALNVFEHDERDVLYIEMVGDSLIELHNKIGELPFSRPQTHPRYIPHLTLAYVKKGEGRKFIGTTPFKRVISARGLTVIDANGIEQVIPAVPVQELEREPLLLAGA